VTQGGARALLIPALLLACFGPRIDRPAEIDAAVADLARAGFEFDADVAFARDAYVMCEGVSCSELRIVERRRTILLARDAFASPSRLRASLLDIQGRYRNPRAASAADQARSAVRILRDGPRVGVSDRRLLRETHHLYRQLYGGLSADERAELPGPDDLEYP
jgi:hypothetical protein